MIFVEQLPGAADERLASRSSSAPGASPRKHSRAFGSPTPNTVCVRVLASSSQRVQPATSCCSTSSVGAGGARRRAAFARFKKRCRGSRLPARFLRHGRLHHRNGFSTCINCWCRRFSKCGFLLSCGLRCSGRSLADKYHFLTSLGHEALRLVREYGVVTPSLEQPISGLSGGNQQKSVLARSFLYGADVVLIDEADARRRCRRPLRDLPRHPRQGSRG